MELHANNVGDIGRYIFAHDATRTFCRACGVALTNERQLSPPGDESVLDEQTDRLHSQGRMQYSVNLRIFPRIDMGGIRRTTRKSGGSTIYPPCVNP